MRRFLNPPLLVPAFDPRNPAAHAPYRHLVPSAWPRPAAVRAAFGRRGIDADDLAALMAETARHGWLWRLGGGGGVTPNRSGAMIRVPWIDPSAWAFCWGDSPAAALACALAMALDAPPPPEELLDVPPEHRAAWIAARRQ